MANGPDMRDTIKFDCYIVYSFFVWPCVCVCMSCECGGGAGLCEGFVGYISVSTDCCSSWLGGTISEWNGLVFFKYCFENVYFRIQSLSPILDYYINHTLSYFRWTL